MRSHSRVLRAASTGAVVVALTGAVVALGGCRSATTAAPPTRSATPVPTATPTRPPVATGPVAPATVQGDRSFYAQDQVDQAWADLVEHYPQPLPAGVAFPEPAPAFLHPDDGETHVFQTGLPEQIAAQYWRCAWLDAYLTAGREADGTQRARASAMLAHYPGLPGITAQTAADRTQAMQAGADIARRIPHQDPDLTAEQYEYDIDCALYTQDHTDH